MGLVTAAPRPPAAASGWSPKRIALAARRSPLAAVALVAALACTRGAWGQGRLQGKFLTPTGGPVANGTLLLGLSQAAVLPGSNAVVPSTVSCATSTDGSVVGVSNPVATPSGTATPTAGSLGQGTYFVAIAYTGASGTTTLASPPLVLSLPGAGGKLVIDPPALSPASATGYDVYIGPAAGAETLQGAASLGSSFTQDAPLAAGTALPALNTTVCSLTFNDDTVPSYTYYAATLEDFAGNVLPGYPQNWFLAGSAVDVSQIEPLTSNPALRFPEPLLLNPSTSAAQSVASGINLNNFTITASGNVGPGFYSAFWAGSQPAVNSVLGFWTPNTAVQLRRLDINAQTAGSGGTVGTTIQATNGPTICTFGGLLIGAATSASNGNPTAVAGGCVFAAGLPIEVTIAGDDHTVQPQNISWSIEMTSH